MVLMGAFKDILRRVPILYRVIIKMMPLNELIRDKTIPQLLQISPQAREIIFYLSRVFKEKQI
jgi:hypothetical protein